MDDPSTNVDPLITSGAPTNSPSQPSSRSDLETSPYSHSDSGVASGRLEIRCPGCRVSIEVAADTSFTDLTCSSCGSHFSLIDQSQATRMAPPLTKMGRFDLIERIGLGGFGSVWKARDKELDRTVAIKIPRQSGMTGEEQEKFFREARAAAQLKHPSIVSVHEVGRDGESVYIVSDFVRGVTLGDWLTGQQLTNREAVELCAKIADALQHAHEQGVVHRDLKPANIMIDADGEPHLMDFGLARREVGEVTVTLDGQVLGTPAYMSPEQALGEGHTADRRSDVYSLGVILFHLLTGELPFRGNPRMLVHQVINDEPPSPRKFNANVRRDLETIVAKCLEKLPAKRYQTARELADELHRFLRGEPILARPIGPLEKAWRWAKRKPAVAALGSISAIVIVAATTLLSLGYARESSLRVDATKARATADESRIRAEEAATRNRAQWYAATMNVAAQAWEDGSIRQLTDVLLSQTPKAGEPDLRGFEWYYWWGKCKPFRECSIIHTQEARIITNNAAPRSRVNYVRYSPDGRRLAVALSNGYVGLWDAADCQLKRTLFTESNRVTSVDFSHDGALLVSVGDDGRALIWNLAEPATTTPRAIRHEGAGIVRAAMSPRGDSVCSAGMDGKVQTWNARSGEPEKQLAGHDASIESLAYSPNGEFIAAGGADEALIVWNAKTGDVLHRLHASPDHAGGLSFDSTSSKLAASAYQRIHVFNVQTGELITTHFCHPNELVFAIDWSRDGRMVATSGGDNNVELWALESGDRLNILKGHRDAVLSIHFSPDGKHLASAGLDESVIRWSLPDDRLRDELSFQQDDTHPPIAFTPKSAIAASVGPKGQIAVWNSDTTELIEMLEGHVGGIVSLAFLPDGRLASYGSDRTVKLWNLDDKTSETLAAAGRPSGMLAVDPRGQTLAFLDGYASIKLLNCERFTEQAVLRGHMGVIMGLSFSPDGATMASAAREISGAGEMYIWNTADGAMIASHEDLTTQIYSVAFSPDGKLCAGGIDDGVQIIDPKSGKPLAKLRAHTAAVGALAFSPDGKTLASGDTDGKIQFWDVPTISAKGAVTFNNSAVINMAFNSAGTVLAVARSNGKIQLLHAERPRSSQGNDNRPVMAELVNPRETWAPDVLISQLASRTRRSAEGVAEAVAVARKLPIEALISNSARITLGEWLILDEQPQKASAVLAEAVARGGTGYYHKSHGWALWAAGDTQQAIEAFEKTIGDTPLADASLDQWAAAYFLDRVSEEEFIKRSEEDPNLKETFAWFYIGQRREKERTIDEAIDAYQNAVDAAKRYKFKRGISNWAAYRLTRLRER